MIRGHTLPDKIFIKTKNILQKKTKRPLFFASALSFLVDIRVILRRNIGRGRKGLARPKNYFYPL